MRRIIKYLIIVLIGFITGYLIVQINSKYDEKKEIEKRIQTLPDAAFASVYGGSINLQDFDSGRSLVLIYFHPECEHCQYEAKEIGLRADEFNNCQLVMVTPDVSLARIEKFCEEYQLWEIDNIEVLLDRESKFELTFGNAVLPSVYIYDKGQKLKKQFLGETKPEAIVAEIGSDSDTQVLESE
jgi:peroxiredoxin